MTQSQQRGPFPYPHDNQVPLTCICDALYSSHNHLGSGLPRVLRIAAQASFSFEALILTHLSEGCNYKCVTILRLQNPLVSFN